MEKKGILNVFKNELPVIGMLHLKGKDDQDIFERFKRELAIYIEQGVDGVIAENYFGSYRNLVQALEYLDEEKPPIPYGVNCLNVDHMGFWLAEKYHASFVQLDSVVGHIQPRDEELFQAFMDVERNFFNGCVLGGVRFKYQPVLSEKSLQEDLTIATGRCDGVCVTQDRTGQETPIERIKEFKDGLGDFPLIVAAGVTANNIAKAFEIADGAIIGSYFKDSYQDDGDVCPEHIKEIVNLVNGIRKKGLQL